MSDARIFISYAHADEMWFQRFRSAFLEKSVNLDLRFWSDHALLPGENWHQAIVKKLHQADIIIFLITQAFLSSSFIKGQEMRRAIARHDAGLARVVPILVESCSWQETPFAKIQGMPAGMVPIASLSNSDETIQNIIEELAKLAKVVKPGVQAYETGLEDFTDAQLVKLMNNVEIAIRVAEGQIASFPEIHIPLPKLLELEELRQRRQDYEDEFQRRTLSN
jgi:hypothetical protein